MIDAMEANSSSIKLLHVIYSFNMGGLENGLVNLINNLPSEQFSHTICILSRGRDLLPRLDRKIRYYELLKRDGNDFRLPLKIASIIRKEKVDIVHTRNWVALVEGVTGAAIGGCKRVVHSEHGKEIEDTLNQPWRRRIAKQACFAYVKKIITVSKALEDEFVYNNLCDFSKITTIINGVDCNKFNIKSQQDISNLRRKYQIPEEAFVIGSVGRFAKIKNFSYLLDILCYCQDQFLVLVGDGPERAAIEQKAQRMSLAKRCVFMGEIENVSDVLNTFDVFVNTSFYEGISNTILEAMACGIPVVANNVGGTSEIILNGITGFLINGNEKKEFIDTLKDLQNNALLRQNLSRASRRIVEEKYSLRTMVNNYREVYMSLI